MSEFTHMNKYGRGKMINIGGKDITERTAVAKGKILLAKETIKLIETGGTSKGDVLAVAQVAGILAAKKTPELIPMCHGLNLSSVDLTFSVAKEGDGIEIEAEVKVTGQTGVEMEALTAVSVAALTIYDMCKAVDKEMEIGPIYLQEKKGGQSGHYIRRV